MGTTKFIGLADLGEWTKALTETEVDGPHGEL
jgi:hypothetical protein